MKADVFATPSPVFCPLAADSTFFKEIFQRIEIFTCIYP
jgi:hypothetical protein